MFFPSWMGENRNKMYISLSIHPIIWGLIITNIYGITREVNIICFPLTHNSGVVVRSQWPPENQSLRRILSVGFFWCSLVPGFGRKLRNFILAIVILYRFCILRSIFEIISAQSFSSFVTLSVFPLASLYDSSCSSEAINHCIVRIWISTLTSSVLLQKHRNSHYKVGLL